MMDPLPSARVLAEMSAKAYQDFTIQTSGDVEILIEWIDDWRICAFRGTQFNYSDIFRDLRGYPWWSSMLQAWCHRGFLIGARNAYDLMRGIGKDVARRTILTGHSKGGAEATLVGAMMVADGVPPVALTTFGSPRTGFASLRQWYEVGSPVTIDRYVHRGDPVTTVPWLLGRYKHIGMGTRIGQPDPEATHNHRIARYLAALPAS
jgi:hypothetical protein